MQFSKNYSPYPLGGDKRDRTAGLLLARQALSQMSYTPICLGLPIKKKGLMVGLDGLEPSTSRLSGVRSNHLSYRPASLTFKDP